MVNEIISGDILNVEQLKKHSKIYAGPGAGKTYFLVENVKNILTTNESIVNSKSRKVLCITYTNTAVNEIQKRLERYIDYVEAYTIHGFIIEHIIKPFQDDLIGIMKSDFNISVSKKGYELSLLLKKHLDKDSTIINTDIYYKDVKNTFKLLFYEYDAIIAIMASGILIRSIAPLIKSKVYDPAILNIDENANFVISTLSGHLGGANKLTSKVANMLNATEVITTATDVNKKLGVDVIAKDLYLTVKNPNEIIYFNKAILNNEEIMFRVNSKENYDFLFDYLNENTLEIDVSIEFTSSINTDEIHVLYKNHKLIMKIEDIVVGIGCKRGKSKEDILTGLDKALDDLNISKKRLSKLASGEIKKEETGILDLSKMLNIPVNFVEMDKLTLFKSEDIHESEFVKSKFGVGSVSEASALITAGFDSKLIYKKTAFDGVTIALAVSKKD